MKKETSQTVDRALQLLNLFSRYEELGISDAALLLKIDRTSVSRLVGSLEAADFIQQNPANRKYRLGMRLLYLGTLVRERNELTIRALPFMEKLSSRFQVSCMLCGLEKNQVRVFHKVSAGPVAYMSAEPGLLLPAHCMGSGKLLLANSGAENIRAYLSGAPFHAYTPNTITNAAGLAAELQRILQQGYSDEKGEATIGMSCVAVPVREPDGRAIASLSLSGQSELIRNLHDDLLKALLEASGQISLH